MVKSDSDATCASADSSEIVFIYNSVDYVLAATNFFQILSLEIFREIGNFEINNLRIR